MDETEVNHSGGRVVLLGGQREPPGLRYRTVARLGWVHCVLHPALAAHSKMRLDLWAWQSAQDSA